MFYSATETSAATPLQWRWLEFYLLCLKHQKLTFEKKSTAVCISRKKMTQLHGIIHRCCCQQFSLGQFLWHRIRRVKTVDLRVGKYVVFFCDNGWTDSDCTVSGSLWQCIPPWRELQWGPPLSQSSRSMAAGPESAHTGCLLRREKLVGWGTGWNHLPCCQCRISITYNDRNIVLRHYKTVTQNRGNMLHTKHTVLNIVSILRYCNTV